MLTITNKNIYRSQFSLVNCTNTDDIEKIDIEDITKFLSDYVELGESVTFKRLFEIVSFNVDKFNEIFYSTLGGYKLEPYLQEIENIPTENVETDCVEVHWYCDKYEDTLNITPSIHGISLVSEDVYALDFVSLNNIKNNIVKINESVKIFNYNEIKSNNEEPIKPVVLGNKAFTLFDLFNGIFYEISFHGGPQDKKERFQEIEDQIDEIKDDESKSISIEEMMDWLDVGDVYLVKYKELRERVDKNRIKNDKNLDKLKNCLLEKLKIYDEIENSDNLEKYYKKLTDLEYSMQILYGEEEDISYHRFWETPKCTCPKIDNLEIYPSQTPIFNDKCPIHGK